MKSRLWILLALALLLAAFLRLAASVSASPAAQLQQYATPTAGPDGRILYTVQAGDTCTSIALKSNMTVEQLRALNANLNPACDLIAGQVLLLGLAGPAGATPTAGPSPTPTVPVPTPTAFPGTAEVCVVLFNDVNGDGLYQPDTEGVIAGGAASLTGTNYARTLQTVLNPDPAAYPGVCFTDVPQGDYTVSMAIPDGYNATMDVTTSLAVMAGSRVYIDFGAQARNVTVVVTGSGRSPVIGMIGALLLLAGLGLAWYAWRMSRPRKTLLPPS